MKRPMEITSKNTEYVSGAKTADEKRAIKHRSAILFTMQIALKHRVKYGRICYFGNVRWKRIPLDYA